MSSTRSAGGPPWPPASTSSRRPRSAHPRAAEVGLSALSALEEPAAGDQVAEDRQVSAVHQRELEIAPPHRKPGPPAILHNPLLEHAVDRDPGHGPGDPRRVGP